MNMLNVVHVVPRIADQSSGPSHSVPNLCRAISDAGICPRLYTLQPQPRKLLFEPTSSFPTVQLPFARRLGVSPKLKHALRELACSADIIHTHSLWMMPNIYPERATRGSKCRLMVSPRGTLSKWALRRSRIRKWILWHAGQKQALRNAACLHATSVAELEEIRRLGLRNPVAVIPNGIACPAAPDQISSIEKNHRTLLYLARIHPKKGVDVLLRAWREIHLNHPEWRLRIAGPNDHPYARQMMKLSASLGLQRVEFTGELKAESKVIAFRDADLYVLPTHSENFGISVAEALAHGIPSIVFEGAPWSGLNSRNSGWWIAPGIESLVSTLRTAMALPESDLAAMGNRGHEWMSSDFDWSVIGQRMLSVYQWLVHGGDRPDYVAIQ